MKQQEKTAEILETLRRVLPAGRPVIGLHEPYFAGNEWAYVKECIDTGWVSYLGKYVDQFETMLAEFTGVKRAIALVNGTEAIHIALLLAGVEKDDEVLAPAFTFVATINAIAYTGATPHFVDCAYNTLGMDPVKLEAYLKDIAQVRPDGCYNRRTGRRIKAVLPMHTFGHPVDIDPLVELCQRYRLELVEDAAESIGSYYKGRHTGNWGKLAALSFNGNKTVTTGGGGAILTNDEDLGKLAKHLTTTAKLPHKWAFVHDRIGYNYRLPNLNAALGCAQMEQLPQFLAKKRELTEKYAAAFETVAGAQIFREPAFARSNYWLNALLLDKEYAHLRDEILTECHQRGILVRPAWTLMHRLPMYADCPRMELTVAEDLEARLINMPSSVFL